MYKIVTITHFFRTMKEVFEFRKSLVGKVTLLRIKTTFRGVIRAVIRAVMSFTFITAITFQSKFLVNQKLYKT